MKIEGDVPRLVAWGTRSKRVGIEIHSTLGKMTLDLSLADAENFVRLIQSAIADAQGPLS